MTSLVCQITPVHSREEMSSKRSPSPLSTDESFADQWTILSTTIPDGGRQDFASVQLNNELYFVGGYDRNSNHLNSVTSYNCTTNEWTEHPPLLEKRIGCAAAVLNQHEFVVVGGYTRYKNKNKSTLLYNTKTKSWTRLPDLKKRREWPACVCVDKNVYAIGGYNDDDDKHEDSIEVLDLSVSQPSWTILPTRMKQRRWGCAAVVDYNGDIVVTGGDNKDDGFLDSVEVFHTHNQVWQSTRYIPPMLTVRCDHSLVALNRGRILVALGGESSTEYASKSVELLMLPNDGNPLQWIPMPSMKVGRRAFAAFATTTTTQPGILVMNGEDNDEKTLDTMEFLQEPSNLVYWILLNTPPLENPALAKEGRRGYRTHDEWVQLCKTYQKVSGSIGIEEFLQSEQAKELGFDPSNKRSFWLHYNKWKKGPSAGGKRNRLVKSAMVQDATIDFMRQQWLEKGVWPSYTTVRTKALAVAEEQGEKNFVGSQEWIEKLFGIAQGDGKGKASSNSGDEKDTKPRVVDLGEAEVLYDHKSLITEGKILHNAVHLWVGNKPRSKKARKEVGDLLAVNFHRAAQLDYNDTPYEQMPLREASERIQQELQKIEMSTTNSKGDEVEDNEEPLEESLYGSSIRDDDKDADELLGEDYVKQLRSLRLGSCACGTSACRRLSVNLVTRRAPQYLLGTRVLDTKSTASGHHREFLRRACHYLQVDMNLLKYLGTAGLVVAKHHWRPKVNRFLHEQNWKIERPVSYALAQELDCGLVEDQYIGKDNVAIGTGSPPYFLLAPNWSLEDAQRYSLSEPQVDVIPSTMNQSRTGQKGLPPARPHQVLFSDYQCCKQGRGIMSLFRGFSRSPGRKVAEQVVLQCHELALELPQQEQKLWRWVPFEEAVTIMVKLLGLSLPALHEEILDEFQGNLTKKALAGETRRPNDIAEDCFRMLQEQKNFKKVQGLLRKLVLVLSIAGFTLETARALRDYGEIHYKKTAKLDLAREAFEEVLRLAVGDSMLRGRVGILLAKVLHELGSLEEASAQLEQTRRTFAQQDPGPLIMAELNLAIASNNLERRSLHNVEAHLNRAKELIEGQTGVEAIQAAIEEHVAKLSYKRGRLKDALQHAQECIRITNENNPSPVDLASRKLLEGRILFDQDRLQEAQYRLEKAHELVVEDKLSTAEYAKVQHEMAKIDRRQNKPEDALKRYQKAANILLQLAPRSCAIGELYTDMGWVLVSLERHDEAMEYAMQGRDILEYGAPASSGMGACYNLVGRLLFDRGDFIECGKAYGKARAIRRALAPISISHCVTLTNLAALTRVQRQGQPKEAKRFAEEALDTLKRHQHSIFGIKDDHPAIIEAMFQIGQANFDLEQLEDAEMKAKEILELKPDFKWAFYLLTRVYVKLKKTVAAHESWLGVLRSNKDFRDTSVSSLSFYTYWLEFSILRFAPDDDDEDDDNKGTEGKKSSQEVERDARLVEALRKKVLFHRNGLDEGGIYRNAMANILPLARIMSAEERKSYVKRVLLDSTNHWRERVLASEGNVSLQKLVDAAYDFVEIGVAVARMLEALGEALRAPDDQLKEYNVLTEKPKYMELSGGRNLPECDTPELLLPADFFATLTTKHSDALVHFRQLNLSTKAELMEVSKLIVESVNLVGRVNDKDFAVSEVGWLELSKQEAIQKTFDVIWEDFRLDGAEDDESVESSISFQPSNDDSGLEAGEILRLRGG